MSGAINRNRRPDVTPFCRRPAAKNRTNAQTKKPSQQNLLWMQQQTFWDREAEALLPLLRQSEFELRDWKIVEKGCLRHATVLQKTKKTSENDAFSLADAYMESSGDSIEADDAYDSVCVEENDDDDDRNKNNMLLVWDFSIVLSHPVWQCPVLYFGVTEASSGQWLPRSQVLEQLEEEFDDENNEDTDNSWDFVSYEQHPIDGRPACFLHPCRTSERLELLQNSSPSTDDVIPGTKLLAWMALTLPAVGFSLGARDYARMREQLLEAAAEADDVATT